MSGVVSDPKTKDAVLRRMVDIVAAYVGRNKVTLPEVGNIISSVYTSLEGLTGEVPQKKAAPQAPAVPVKKSVTPEYIICLEDGKKFKSLKRHLRTHYDLSPEEYREKWGLPHDYPMVAPNYAAARSDLAKRMGLGQRRR